MGGSSKGGIPNQAPTPPPPPPAAAPPAPRNTENRTPEPVLEAREDTNRRRTGSESITSAGLASSKTGTKTLLGE